GGPARILDVSPLTPADGAALLAVTGGNWLSDSERRRLAAAVDGHALAVSALGGLLADRPSIAELDRLRTGLAAAVGTDARVARVLGFYAGRLTAADRYLVAAVALFTRPVDSGRCANRHEPSCVWRAA